MLSTFQVITRAWFPERVTAELAARVKSRFAVEHDVAPPLDVATSLKLAFERAPAAPVAFVHVAAFQLTSAGAQVALPPGS